jgi:hypothetical protein
MTAKQWLCRLLGWGLAYNASCSFNKLWCGEAYHELVVQSADVSALPFALAQTILYSASQQSPWFMELTGSAAVSQSPSWISLPCFLNPFVSSGAS